MRTSNSNRSTEKGFTLPSDERVDWFLRYIHRMMSQRLDQNMDAVYVHGIDEISDLALKPGVIIAPNHVSYWDSCLYFVLSQKLSARAFVFVAKDTLQRLPFLRWCGAVPINTQSKGDAIQQLIHAKALNTTPTQFWIFPQGEHRPTHHTPLQFKKGVTILGEQLRIPIVPVAIDYLYKDNEQPITYVSFRPPMPYSSSVEDIEQEITRGLKDITARHLGDLSLNFVSIYKPRKSTDGMATRMLAWFAGLILGNI